MSQKKTKTVLVAPLDWGLGHAARCVPIIKELETQSFTVIIAASGAIKTLLKKEFPAAGFVELPGYNIRYSRNKKWFTLRLLQQLPSVLSVMRNEQQWLKHLLKELPIDIVIADNRPGLFSRNLHCIYITHQINIYTGNKFSGKLASFIHQRIIQKFNQCWIPDYPGSQNLAGQLSHPVPAKLNASYIGCLSRLATSASENTVDLLIVLSGPEPQRSIFENILLEQLRTYTGKVVFVRGTPGDTTTNQSVSSNIRIYDHLDATALSQAMMSAELIICRSGYTSIMDLCKLRRKALLVPTPGQTEQEYLAAYLAGRQLFSYMQQEDFNLQAALELAAGSNTLFPEFDMNQYKTAIQQLASL